VLGSLPGDANVAETKYHCSKEMEFYRKGTKQWPSGKHREFEQWPSVMTENIKLKCA
jgi:hypothetical protein